MKMGHKPNLKARVGSKYLVLAIFLNLQEVTYLLSSTFIAVKIQDDAGDIVPSRNVVFQALAFQGLQHPLGSVSPLDTTFTAYLLSGVLKCWKYSFSVLFCPSAMRSTTGFLFLCGFPAALIPKVPPTFFGHLRALLPDADREWLHTGQASTLSRYSRFLRTENSSKE